MEVRVIRSDKDYHAALKEAEALIATDPTKGSKDGDRLELLTVLIEDFERKQFSFEIPDPIEAIEFRMEQQGLRQKDLVPLVGSRSRVSELLARKRPLTVPMIRALATGLGIPLEALIAAPSRQTFLAARDSVDFDWSKFPIREMQKRGWLQSIKAKANASIEEVVRAFLSQVSLGSRTARLYGRNFRGENLDERSYYSALAWTARVLMRAKSEKGAGVRYDPSRITDEFLRNLARLSWLPEGPKLAVEFLAKVGVVVVIEPKLPNTLIDGAAMLSETGVPVIGLTLRYDRVDYFWFTLLHELVHVWRHLNTPEDAFVDRIENIGSDERAEKEANRLARDSFIPRAVWKRSPAFLSPTRENIQRLADELQIHPALVVGRLHYETGRFESFREFLGERSIRRLFPETSFA